MNINFIKLSCTWFFFFYQNVSKVSILFVAVLRVIDWPFLIWRNPADRPYISLIQRQLLFGCGFSNWFRLEGRLQENNNSGWWSVNLIKIQVRHTYYQKKKPKNKKTLVFWILMSKDFSHLKFLEILQGNFL